MKLLDFIITQKGDNFTVSKNDQPDMYREVASLVGDGPSFVVYNRSRYLVTSDHDHLSCCDVNDVNEYFTFTNVFDIPESKIYRVL